MREVSGYKAIAYLNGAVAGLAMGLAPEIDNPVSLLSQSSLLPATIFADDSYYYDMMVAYNVTSIASAIGNVAINGTDNILTSIAGTVIVDMISGLGRSIFAPQEAKDFNILPYYKEVEVPVYTNVSVPVYYDVPVHTDVSIPVYYDVPVYKEIPIYYDVPVYTDVSIYYDVPVYTTPTYYDYYDYYYDYYYGLYY